MLAVLKTADVIRRRLTSLLAPFDLTPQQYNVLRIVRGAGKDGIPTLAIGERLIEETPGITRLLDRMERKGWVRRERCPKDRRQVLCYLAPEGKRLLERIPMPSGKDEARILNRLPPKDTQKLVAFLDHIRES